MRVLRNGLLWCAVHLLLAWSAAADEGVSLTAVVQKHNISWEEALGGVLLARALDLDVTVVFSTCKATGSSIFPLAPAFVLSKESRKNVQEILKRHRGKAGWGSIAHQLGVHPGAFNKTRVWLSKASDDEVVEALWILVLGRYFDFSSRQLRNWRRQGLTWGDVVAALHIASGAGISPKKVIAAWRENKNWDRVRSQFRVSPNWLPGEKARKPPSQGQRQGQGKAQRQGSGKRHGHSR